LKTTNLKTTYHTLLLLLAKYDSCVYTPTGNMTSGKVPRSHSFFN